MWHKVRTAFSLPARDQWDLAKTWILLILVDFGLRLLPFKNLIHWLNGNEPFSSRSESANPVTEIRRLSHVVNIAARYHLYPMTCLRQALVLRWLLARSGVQADLKIGVRKEGGRVWAHAWLEYQGKVIGQPSVLAERFASLRMQESELMV